MTLYSATIMLFLVIDPIGNIPGCLSVLNPVKPQRRKPIILRENIFAFITLSIFLFFGKYMLDGMQISQPALSISGGVILFLVAIKMIFPSDKEQMTKALQEPFIVPLAIPLLAGPSTMALVMLLATQSPQKIWLWFTALGLACLMSTIIMVFADNLRKILGERGLMAIEKLTGMVLTTLAVQMFMSGVADFLHV